MASVKSTLYNVSDTRELSKAILREIQRYYNKHTYTMTEEEERLLKQVEDDARKHMKKKGHKGAAKAVLEYIAKVRKELG